MASRGQNRGGGGGAKVMVQPITQIFRFLQAKVRVQIWLFEQSNTRLEGRLLGFDEYMNVVLDDAEEIHLKRKQRKSLGRLLLKGDNITLINPAPGQQGGGPAEAASA
eukprot:gb/GECG01003497.1/.p1 GENE.gb/GECG01003497.1/~~gb/GECG01003497.1/.p1  ORF type:complete len:108 (+),score=13.54 gb/GECG01003497.1/:1-324(+)